MNIRFNWDGAEFYIINGGADLEIVIHPLKFDPQYLDGLAGGIQWIKTNFRKLLAITEISRTSFPYWYHGMKHGLYANASDPDEIIKEIINEKFLFNSPNGEIQLVLQVITDEYQRSQQKTIKKELIQQRRREFAKERPEITLSLIERDGYKCVTCSTLEDLTVDHKVPISKGGTDDLDNLQFMCKSHNSKKGNRVVAL